MKKTSKIVKSPYISYKGQYALFANKLPQRHFAREAILRKNRNKFRWHPHTSYGGIKELYRRTKNIRRSPYNTLPHFLPGDKVYVIQNNGFGARVVQDTIDEVYFFGRKYSLKDYWLKENSNGHGIDSNDIYKNFNEAKFYLYW